MIFQSLAHGHFDFSLVFMFLSLTPAWIAKSTYDLCTQKHILEASLELHKTLEVESSGDSLSHIFWECWNAICECVFALEAMHRFRPRRPRSPSWLLGAAWAIFQLEPRAGLLAERRASSEQPGGA